MRLVKDKILLEVHLPVTHQKYDVWVSDGLQAQVCTELLARTLEELSNGRYRPSGDAVLCDYETGAVFNMSLSVQALGLRNGSRVLLI